jgi:chromosome segregation ATPase
MTGPALQEELENARTDARNAEQIAVLAGWRDLQAVEASRARLVVEQIQYLLGEAESEISRLTATGDSLNDRVLAGNALVVAAITAGDAAAAERNQAAINDAGQALARTASMLATAQANRDAAEAQLPAAASELAVAEGYVSQAEDECTRIEALSGTGVPWDAPAPAAPREWPSGLGLGGEMILRQILEDNMRYLTTPLVRKVGEEIRPRDPKPKSWSVKNLNKKPRTAR